MKLEWELYELLEVKITGLFMLWFANRRVVQFKVRFTSFLVCMYFPFFHFRKKKRRVIVNRPFHTLLFSVFERRCGGRTPGESHLTM